MRRIESLIGNGRSLPSVEIIARLEKKMTRVEGHFDPREKFDVISVALYRLVSLEMIAAIFRM